ncbi:hydroxycinnamoyltransferase-like [Magnolia sinica]|uniref:hydroxycinnamoyltransferase-like n=1 Tax=Magnolia sinica TaxID=86752 RepID=UPI0026588A3F|nr:hydroxycinnamoyltransferase-like [Magnolia sinica]
MSDANNTRVAVRALMTAVSTTPVRPGKTHPLSAMDHLMGVHHLRMVYYYRSDASVEMEKLKESLSDMLSHYPVLTGRLRRAEGGNWEVKCSDAGVRFLEATVDATLDEWLRSAHASEEKDLTHWEKMPEDPYIWSPFHIKINEFEGGGIAIGLSCTHILSDPTCATLLVKAWSDVHRGSTIAYPPFFHPPGLRGRDAPNTDTKSAKFYASKSKAKPPAPVKMSTATFRFSDAMVKKHLSEIHAECPDATPFDMLAALFWSRVMHAKSPMHVETHSLSICIDFRKLMHAPLPHGYFGNALHFSGVSSTAAEMEEGGLGFVAGLIHRHVSGLEEEEYWSAINWVESQKDEGGRFAPPFTMYGPELTCANMEHVFAYSAMFAKDVKPVHVAYHVGNVEGDGLILVLPSPEEGLGRTVTVTLPVEQTAKLLNDEAILCLKPAVLFSGKA